MNHLQPLSRKSPPEKKSAISEYEAKGASSKRTKKTQEKYFVIDRVECFDGIIILKGRVIDTAVVGMFGIEELLEKIEN